MQKTFSFPDIGIVKVTKKRQVRNLTIRVKSSDEVAVTIPFLVSYETALSFVRKNIAWIKEKQASYKNAKNQLFSPDTIFRTRKYQLRFISGNYKNIHSRITNSEIKILYPEDFKDFENKSFQKFIKKTILKALKIEAEEFLLPKIESLSKKHNLPYNTAKIGYGKQRLGWCNAQNDISLSAILVLLPEHLIDYIILHELSHTKQKNHSKEFYKLLNDLTDNNVAIYKRGIRNFKFSIVPGDYRYN